MIPIGLATVVAVSVITMVWRISAKSTQVLSRLSAIERKLDDHWTRADHLEWVIDFKAANLTMDIPLPRRRETNGYDHKGEA